MTRVHCYNTDCIYCALNDCSCIKDIVSIGEDYECGCDDYSPYYETEEYNQKYYIAVKADGKPAKAVRYHGKLIEYNGRTFFTADRITDGEYYRLTEKRTGVDVGTFAKLKTRWEKFIELEKQIPDVETLPLAEYDGHGKYKIVGGRNEHIKSN